MFNKDEFNIELVKNKTSQRKLAKEIGMSENTMSSRTNGRSPFTTDEIDRICEALHIYEDVQKVKIFLYNPSHKRDDIVLK